MIKKTVSFDLHTLGRDGGGLFHGDVGEMVVKSSNKNVSGLG